MLMMRLRSRMGQTGCMYSHLWHGAASVSCDAETVKIKSQIMSKQSELGCALCYSCSGA